MLGEPLDDGVEVAVLDLQRDQPFQVVALPSPPWLIGCQCPPEFPSTPRAGHPLFTAFVEAALQYQTSRTKPAIAA